MATELDQALQAMGRVNFADMDPAHQATMGSFLERALDEIMRRQADVTTREQNVSRREADVQIREDRVAKQVIAVASAQRLKEQLGFVAQDAASAKRGWLTRRA